MMPMPAGKGLPSPESASCEDVPAPLAEYQWHQHSNNEGPIVSQDAAIVP